MNPADSELVDAVGGLALNEENSEVQLFSRAHCVNFRVAW